MENCFGLTKWCLLVPFVHLRISLPVLPGQLASVVYVIVEMSGTNRKELFVQIRWDNLSWLAHFLGVWLVITKCHKTNISKRLWMDEEDLTSSCLTVGLLRLCFRLWSNMHDSSPSKSRQYVKKACWKSVQSPRPEETHTPSHITARSSAPFIQLQRCTLALWIVNKGSNNSQHVTFSLQNLNVKAERRQSQWPMCNCCTGGLSVFLLFETINLFWCF